MQHEWAVRKTNAWQVLACSFALTLAFGSTALWSRQVQQEPSPPTQPQAEQSSATPSQAPPAAAQSDSTPQPGTTPPAQEPKSPLEQLDDFEPRAKASPPPAPAEVESLHVLLGRPLVVTSPAAICRFSLADPDILDLVVLSTNEILVVGKQRGRTSLVVGDATGQSEEFDVNVECDAPVLPAELLPTLACPQAPASAREDKQAWIYWMVIGSIAVLGGAILSVRRRRSPQVFKLELRTEPSNSRGLGLLVEPGVEPYKAPEENHAEEEDVVAVPAGPGTTSPGGMTGNAERNQRLLRTYLEAATRGIFPAGPDGRRGGSPLAKRPADSPPTLNSGPPTSGESQVNNASALQPHPLLDTVTALAFAVDARGPYSTGHSQAVSRLAARIAIQAGLSVEEVEEARLAGLLHDIGMIHVPDTVCNKPERLSPEEFDVMSRHSAWGAKMLEPLNVKAIERIVRHHHERFDGEGYPDRLAADQIPLGARIVAVAESFHSMLSDLPYKSARTFEDALAELRRCSGLQFDPTIVVAFLDWLQSYSASAKRQKA
jgi:putative nucleotidyltransferase with HDIG domain